MPHTQSGRQPRAGPPWPPGVPPLLLALLPVPHLLLGKPLLDLLVITDIVNNRLGELGLDSRQPGAEVAHVFVQLLNESKRLLQLLHPECKGRENPLSALGSMGHDGRCRAAGHLSCFDLIAETTPTSSGMPVHRVGDAATLPG